jgi:hypothetical protein
MDKGKIVNGVIYVAMGHPARKETAESIRTLRQHSHVPIAVVSDKPLGKERHIYAPDADLGGRVAKLSLGNLSPFEQTCYLDADTRVYADLSAGFAVLDDGWDLVIAPSTRQGGDALGNLDQRDRDATFTVVGQEVLALQAGVFFWRRCEAMAQLFAAWHEEWRRFGRLDQGALLRALWKVPVRVWMLSNEWNGGQVIGHLFGRARR